MATTNDVHEEELKPTGLPEQEKIMMSEEELIAGLLEAADFETDEDNTQPVEIRRNGVLKFRFSVHPLSEKELMRIRKQSTPYYKNPAGAKLPKIEGDLRLGEFRSRKIYAATCEEDRRKLWDNPKVKAGLIAKGKTIIEEWEIIDAVLMAGEKDRINSVIDEINGYHDDSIELEEYAKN